MARKSIRSEHNGVFPIREDGRVRSNIEVHVAGVCVRPTNDHWEVLIAQRTIERHLYPGKWECGGGQVNYGEGLNDAVKRQIFEEFGLEVEPYALLEIYEIHVPGPKRVINGVRFLCLASDGVIRLNSREFTQYQWVGFPVPADLDWIEGVKKMLDTIGPELLSKLPQRKAPDTERGPRSIPSTAVQ
jgi:8-oxo-dGTP diphosphatase